MCDMRHWKVILLILAAVAVILPVARHLASAKDMRDDKARLEHGVPTNPAVLDPPALAGVDVLRMEMGAQEVTAPAAERRTAHLSLDPELQQTALRVFRKRSVPEGAFVLMDLGSQRLLVYASTNKGAPRDGCAEAKAPAASVFKVITGTALVQAAGLAPSTKQCYRGGLHGITLQDLIEDEKRDKYCATLTQAMGRSLNTVFGRLGLRHLDAAVLTKTAQAYGFGKPLPFDIPVQPSTLTVPEGDLEFARTCAGFWNSTLSPMQGAVMMATIAQGGALLQPVLVNSVTDEDGDVIYRAPAAPLKIRQAIAPETAAAVREMMGSTVSDGTAHKQFHDQRGRSFLPDIKIASKTGTLTDPKTREFYTWLVGFAPADKPEVAFAALVTNGANWRTRGPLLAREMLRAYFASRGAPGVTPP